MFLDGFSMVFHVFSVVVHLFLWFLLRFGRFLFVGAGHPRADAERSGEGESMHLPGRF